MGTPTSKFALWAKFQPAMGCSGNLVLGRKQPRFLVDEVHCLKIVWEARTAAKARPLSEVSAPVVLPTPRACPSKGGSE
jgi:hypothetical protein